MDPVSIESVFFHEETRNYFRKKFGSWRKASATKVRRHFEALVSSDLLSIARLNHYAGIVFLEQENPVEAESFVQKSVDQYQKCSKEFPKCWSVEKQKDFIQAKIFLAQSWVRNYSHLEQAEKVLRDVLETRKDDHVREHVNYSLAGYSLLEALMLVETSRLMAAFEGIIDSSQVITRSLQSRQPEIFKALCIEETVLFFEYGFRFRYFDLVDEMGVSIRSRLTAEPNTRFAIIKASARRSSLDVFSNLCGMSRKAVDDLMHEEENESGPLFASLLFSSALLLFTGKHFDCAGKSFNYCCEIRTQFLGAKHLETIRAQFMQGYLMALSCSGAPFHQESHVNLMTDALDVIEKKAEQTFWFYPEMFQYYAKCRTEEGKFWIAEKYFKKAVDAEEKLKNGDKSNTTIALRQIEFAKLHMNFQKWQSVLDLNLPAVSNAEFETYEGIVVADAYGAIAYCYFKLEKHELAEKNFAKAITAMDVFEDKSDREWAIMKVKILGYKIEFEITAMKRLEVAEMDFKMASKLMKVAKKSKTSCFEPKASFQLGFYYEFVKQSYSEAIDCYLLSSKATGLRYFKAHPYYCDCSLALARIYFKQFRMDEGHEMLKSAFKQACSLFDTSDPYFEPFFDLFQENVSQQKRMKQAYNVFSTTVKMLSEQKFPASSYLVATFGYNFAKRVFENDFVVVGQTGCQDLLKKSLKVFKKVFGTKDKRSGHCERILGLCCLKNGDAKGAEWHLYQSALALIQNV